MSGHICRQDHLNDNLPDLHVVLIWKVAQNVQPLILQKHEGVRHMMIFKYRLIIVEQCQIVFRVD